MMTEKRKNKLITFNKTTILETANRLFLEQGLEKTTMDEIAKTAGYSKTTLYVYFKNKDDIVNHLSYEGMEILYQRVQKIADEEDDCKEFFLKVCAEFADFYNEYPVYFQGITGRMMRSEEDLVTDEMIKRLYDTGEEIAEIIIRKINQTIKLDQTVFLIMWFALIGIIEKTSVKDDYIIYQLQMTKEAFMQLSFESLYQLVSNQSWREISDKNKNI